MKTNNLNLPSNKKFGFFFTLILIIIAIYSHFKEFKVLYLILGILAFVFLIITLLKAHILKPLNKLWMRFGLVLGMIFSPIVMGFIFFFIFTPIGVLMRLFGRDELCLKFKKKSSYWVKRNNDIYSNSFRSQF